MPVFAEQARVLDAEVTKAGMFFTGGASRSHQASKN